MEKSKINSILRGARNLISDRNNWCQGDMIQFYEGEPVRYCALGSIAMQLPEEDLDLILPFGNPNQWPDSIKQIIQEIHNVKTNDSDTLFWLMVNANDAPNEHEDILMLFDDAIARTSE